MTELTRHKQALKAAHEAGDKESAKKLATYIRQRQSSVQQEPVQQEEPKNYIERVGENFKENYAAAQDISKLQDEGKISKGEEYYRRGAKGVAAAGSVVGEAVVSAARGAGKVASNILGKQGTENVKEFASDTAEAVASSPVGQAAGAVSGKVSEELEEFGEKYPRTSGMLQATGEYALGASEVIPAAATIGKGSKIAGKGLSAANTKTVIPNADKLHEAATTKYKDAADAGLRFTEDAKPTFRKAIEDEIEVDELTKGMQGDAAIADILKQFDSRGDAPLTFESFENFDQMLGERAFKASVSGNADEARRLFNVQNKLRDMVHDNKFVEAGEEAIKHYDDAKLLWKTRAKMRDLELIIENAKYHNGGEGAGLKAGFSTLAKRINSGKAKGYTKAEKKLIDKAAKTGSIDGLLRTTGSRLLALGGGLIHGPQGYAAGYALSTAARAGQNVVKGLETTKVGREITKKSRKTAPELYGTEKRVKALPFGKEGMNKPKEKPVKEVEPEKPKPVLALPAPPKQITQQETVVNRKGEAATKRANLKDRERAKELGISPDVSSVIKKDELRKRFGPVWDKVDKESQKRIKDEIEKMWKENKAPITKIIAEAKKNVEELADAKGEKYKTGTMADALLKAKKKQKK